MHIFKINSIQVSISIYTSIMYSCCPSTLLPFLPQHSSQFLNLPLHFSFLFSPLLFFPFSRDLCTVLYSYKLIYLFSLIE